MPMKDISNVCYGKLTALEPEYIDNKYTGKWKCRCDCNTVVFVKAGNLQSGNTKSCGCTRGLAIRLDLIGKEFGRWTALYRVNDKDDRHSKWMCRCTCGSEKVVYQDNLVLGKTVSCGCYRQEIVSEINHVDKTGQQIGQLTILERVDNKKERGVKYLCRCSCGKEIILSTSQLCYRVSCGCAQHIKRTLKDITGHKFGRLTALYRVDLEENTNKKAIWTCQCKCGKVVNVVRSNLTSGNTKSCGCLDDRVNTKPVSQQQRNLQVLLGGELNYKFNNYYIDLFLSDGPCDIAIEYDSHYWHKDTKERDDLKAQGFINAGMKVLSIKGVYKIPSKNRLEKSLNRLYTTDIVYEEIILPNWIKREEKCSQP